MKFSLNPVHIRLFKITSYRGTPLKIPTAVPTFFPMGGNPFPGAIENLNVWNKLAKNKKYSFSAKDCPRQYLFPTEKGIK